ncbi:MarR family transcriptional regulator [uncultured Methanoregula sp.]|uniref:MarR family winged helix-turn-helix transcriptional regulator n=1 Tax=uncultured Methanoregula sp. TaxID=1005933 RepID=UPI002AAB6040|nr:MarR family transcriptional regulator [uncultured Methanoregula sp.]
MTDDVRDRVAENFLAIIPLLYRQIFRVNHGVSGIKTAQYRVLGILKKAGPLSMSEIGRHLYISKPYMTALVDSLIGNNWVERQQDATDRRVIRITITPSGKKYLKESLEMYRNDLELLLGDLSDKELEQFSLSLEHLRTILTKIE